MHGGAAAVVCFYTVSFALHVLEEEGVSVWQGDSRDRAAPAPALAPFPALLVGPQGWSRQGRGHPSCVAPAVTAAHRGLCPPLPDASAAVPRHLSLTGRLCKSDAT